jgi:hypothetical protein
VSNIGHAIGSLLAIGFALRILAVIILALKSAPKTYAPPASSKVSSSVKS